jgi:hypothetical protein
LQLNLTKFLSNKKGTATLIIYLPKGTPQGVVFILIAWNLAFDDFLYTFDEDPSLTIGFEDDGALLTFGLDPKTLTHLAQSALLKTTCWSSLRGLTFSYNKTTVILFHRKFSSPVKRLTKLQLNNTPLEYKLSVQYLGITLDCKLSLTEQIKTKLASAKRSLLIQRAALGTLWGPHLTLSSGFMKALSALPFHMAAILGVGFQNKAKRLHRLAQLPMASVGSKNPTAGLEVISGLLPLDLHIQQIFPQTYLRIKTHIPSWDGIGRGKLSGHIFWLLLHTNYLIDTYPNTHSPLLI